MSSHFAKEVRQMDNLVDLFCNANRPPVKLSWLMITRYNFIAEWGDYTVTILIFKQTNIAYWKIVWRDPQSNKETILDNGTNHPIVRGDLAAKVAVQKIFSELIEKRHYLAK